MHMANTGKLFPQHLTMAVKRNSLDHGLDKNAMKYT